ncbi:hypothetical protein ACXHXG_26955 [Rhizobium sp. LEGMi198b]|uniref:hypothetical protein n=1 Tax=unclassified Rhizobium TaxID=2613769 RepID=UPI0021A7F223|nr:MULTISPECIES: hypothetical protein [Rhizobium]MDK4742366.1 hypothetical protein [Rhizobium sp. CNPSo 3464]UWU23715.1 hypothetical protein N2601_26040 [Rhizobium tropici]WFU04446.1 hypothetical protein QA648_27070 [Rhizobium sp. CB3171]
MQERETVRKEIPVHVVDRLENEWRVMQAERSPKLEPEIEGADKIASAPANGLSTR